jgi:hypothetical protein
MTAGFCAGTNLIPRKTPSRYAGAGLLRERNLTGPSNREERKERGEPLRPGLNALVVHPHHSPLRLLIHRGNRLDRVEELILLRPSRMYCSIKREYVSEWMFSMAIWKP